WHCARMHTGRDADRASVLAVCPRPDCCNGEYTVGDACCHGGYTISAEDGTHTITANAPGYKSLSHTVRVTNPKACEPGNPTKLTFKLQPE
ncbi:MAG TPA: hypothetical protein PKA88_17010, partial [Polyangiaceae bacterium]|nr:hypothetical protein [Polyangiaceae bacterium]